MSDAPIDLRTFDFHDRDQLIAACTGRSQHQAARIRGVDQSTISKWWIRLNCDEQAGEPPAPNDRSLELLAAYFEARTVPPAPPPTAARTPGDYATCLVGSDLHFPHHHEGAFEVFLGLADTIKPDEIVLDGDVFDFAQIGKYVRDPNAYIPLQTDIDLCRERILGRINAARLSCVKRFIVGNHEEGRWQNYLFSRCPELASLRCLTMEAVLGLTEMGWTWQPYEYWVTDSLIVFHGDRHTNMLGGGSAMSARKEMMDMGCSGVTGHCFSEDTEILTPTGWKRHNELAVGDPVLTLDATAERASAPLRWNIIDAMNRYEMDGELIRLKSHGLDLLVTDEHGLLTKAKHGKRGVGRGRGSGRGIGWKRQTAAELYGKELRDFPLAGYHNQMCLPLSDAHIRMLAWIMAEGSVDKKARCARIAQSDNDDHLEALECDLEEAGIPYRKVQRYHAGATEHGQHRNYDAYVYRIGVEPLAWVWDYLTVDKTPTDQMRAMSLRQMRAFLETYVIADGSVNRNGIDVRQIASNRKDHIDFLQELAVRTGHRSSVCERPGGMFCLTINGRKTCRVSRTGWSRVSYRGTVWCPTVSNGTLVVRRNGKTAIACNTHHAGAFFRQDRTGYRVWYEIGGLMDWRKMQAAHVTAKRTPVKAEDWHLACALIRYRPGHSAFRVELIPIVDDGQRTFAIWQDSEIVA